MKTWLTLILLSLFLGGCNSGLQTTLNDEQTSSDILTKGTASMPQQPRFEIIKSEIYPSNIEVQKETLVFHSDDAEEVAAFEDAYLALTDEVAPTFDGTMIIATMGQQKSGGYSLEVASVEDAGRYTAVTLLSKTPTGLVTMALSNPYIIIYLPDDHKEIKIIEK